MVINDKGVVARMARNQRTSWGWALIVLVLGIETLGLLWLVWESVMSVVNDSSNPLLADYRGEIIAQGVGITIVVAVGVLWTLFTAIAGLRRHGWARASNLTIQVLVIAAATGILQGIMGSPGLGVALLALGLSGLLGTWLAGPRREPGAEPSRASAE